jgi:hypothetical protein
MDGLIDGVDTKTTTGLNGCYASGQTLMVAVEGATDLR